MSNASLQLLSIICEDKDDAAGKDEPCIKVGGSKVWSSSDFSEGTSANLGGLSPIDFTNRISLELWEEDRWPSRDDKIGEKDILLSMATETGTEYEETFSSNRARYKIRYNLVLHSGNNSGGRINPGGRNSGSGGSGNMPVLDEIAIE